MFYDATSQTVWGHSASFDDGEWAVQINGPLKEVFTIRVRRQIEDYDGDVNEGSGALFDEFSENDDLESERIEDAVTPDFRFTLSPTTPIFDVLFLILCHVFTYRCFFLNCLLGWNRFCHASSGINPQHIPAIAKG